MATVHDEAVCIRHWDWSETSQTVSLFCREIGVVRAVAKGAKREKSPFSGGVELLTRGGAVLIVKPSGAMATLTSWDLLETNAGVRGELRRFYAAMYLADLVGHAIRDEDPHPEAYDALVEGLRALGSASGDVERELLGFQWALLVETGSQPELGADVRTGEALEDSELFGFDARTGGLIADPGAGAAASDGGVWRVRAETVGVLRALASSENAGGSGDDDDAVARAGRLLAAYFRERLGKMPPTMASVYPGL